MLARVMKSRAFIASQVLLMLAAVYTLYSLYDHRDIISQGLWPMPLWQHSDVVAFAAIGNGHAMANAIFTAYACGIALSYSIVAVCYGFYLRLHVSTKQGDAREPTFPVQ